MFFNFLVSFAECIEDNEKILRAHSTVSKRVRTVVQEKIPKVKLKNSHNLTATFLSNCLKSLLKASVNHGT